MRIVLLLVVMLCIACVAFAQIPGSIGIYADAQGTMCSIPEAPDQIVQIYIVHLWTDGATGCQFKVNLPTCLLGLASNPAYVLTQGQFYEDVSINYQICLDSPIYIGFLLALDLGCDNCTYVEVIGNTENIPPGLLVVDCSYPQKQLLVATGGELIYKPVSGQCECDVPAEDTTWGQVKALFE